MHVVHAPHRFYINEQEEHGINQSRVIGGCEECCTKMGLDFYKNDLSIPMYAVSDIKLAELSKIVENSYRFLQIAFAEELKIFCDNAGLDFNELRHAVNTKWNVQVLEARDGIGGHCLPKDSQMFLNAERGLLENSIIRAAKLVDHEYRKHLTQMTNMTQMHAKLQASGKSLQESPKTTGGYT
jgi:UDP-N-acetyl-D-mannosaminuronic acid dehydrogenase